MNDKGTGSKPSHGKNNSWAWWAIVVVEVIYAIVPVIAKALE